jgi:cobalt-zinc-cadmium efflux system membrane fusion protein
MVRNKNRLFPIVAVIVIGVALGGLILSSDKTATPPSADSPRTEPGMDVSRNHQGENENSPYQIGPRGGKLFTANSFGVEVTIFESGVPPQFRLYLYANDKPLPPSEAKVAITLVRLGTPAQVHHFKPEADYLIGDQIVEEPHSFDVMIAADWNGKTFHLKYSQVEFRVEMPDETLESTGVEILTAGPATIKPGLKLLGEIVFNEHTIVQVVPRLPGIVTAVYGHHGMQMKKGEVLAVIESQMLAELRSQYLVAQKRLALAQTTHEREKKLWEDKISAQQDYLAAQTQRSEAEIALDLAAVKLRSLGVRPESKPSEENLARYEIRAPVSGLVTEKAIALGQTLKEDDPIYTVADVSTVWVALTVYPKDLGVIDVGKKATIKATALDLVGEGEITYITPLIGEQTRTATARVELENKGGRWRPGMFVTADVIAEDILVPVAVSADGIQTVGDWTVVFGRYGPYFEARPLELGIGDGRMIEVLTGFQAGEQYAAGNSFAIKAELGKSGASHDH